MSTGSGTPADSKTADKPIGETVKEQFTLLSLLVVLVGTVSTEAYYAQFGLRYQFLELHAEHILFRGLTSVIQAPYLLIPYAVASSWLAYGEALAQARSWSHARLLGATYALIVLVLLVSYAMSVAAGTSAGRRDLAKDTTTLPVVKNMVPGEGVEAPCEVSSGCRLLSAGSDVLFVFVPTSDPNSVPTLKRIESKDYHEIDTGTQ